jgi:hypothetical protein
MATVKAITVKVHRVSQVVVEVSTKAISPRQVSISDEAAHAAA